jgi:hypothetical protein
MIRKSLIALSVVGTLGFAGDPAGANVSSVPGVMFQSFNTSQLTYVTGQSIAALHNTSASYVDVAAEIPYQSGNTVYAGVKITNLTYCQAVVTNGVGNGYWVGSTAYGNTPTSTWQTLNLGTPPVVGGTSLVVHCVLEPGAYIGIAYQ